MPIVPTSNCRTGVIILCLDNYSQEILGGLTEKMNKELEGWVPHVNKWCIATSSFDKLDVRKLLGHTCRSIFTLPIILPIISLRTAVTTEQLPHPTSLLSLSLPSHHSNITTPSASILPELARTPEINRSRHLLSPLTVLAPPDKDTALLHTTQGFTTLSESLFPMAQTSRLQWKSHSSLRIKVLYNPLSKRTSPPRRQHDIYALGKIHSFAVWKAREII